MTIGVLHNRHSFFIFYGTTMKKGLLLSAAMIAAVCATAVAQDFDDSGIPALKGFSLTIDGGATFANKYHAGFYNGNPENTNTINRVLHSESFGTQIWNNLVDQGIISPSAIQNYHQLQVAEYGEMTYSVSFQVGIGFRYDMADNNALFIRFDYSKLTAKGGFNLYSGASTSILSNTDKYISCGITGTESRTYIDLGFSKSFPISDQLHFALDIGMNVNNYHVLSNDIEIAGTSYSILDVWNGESPTAYTATYEYYQTGIGYGAFATPCLRYLFPNSMAVDLGLTAYYNKINLPGYDGFRPQFTLFARFIMNNL